MKCYANLYRDAAGRGFFDNAFDSSDLARQYKTENPVSDTLDYVATVAIVVTSDAPRVPRDLICSALLNTAVPREPLHDSTTYKEKYVIHAVPSRSPESGDWVAKVTIVCDRGADTRIDEHTNNEARFATRDEAVAESLRFGRDIIDAEIADR